MIGKKMAVKLIDFGESYYPGLISTFVLIKIINLEYQCLIVHLKTIPLKKITLTKTIYFLLESYFIIY